MKRLDGKVVIVTGGAGGMGETHTKLFAAEGAKVVFTDLNVEKGKEIEKSIGENALFLEHDVTSEEEWENVIKKAEETFGPVNVLVNNAGIGGASGTIENYDMKEYDKVIAINQTGTFLGMKYVIPSMKKAKIGSIINISSLAGLIGSKGLSPYIATKFAVRGLTKAAAAELGEFNIRANSIHPGLIETQMVVKAAEQDEGMKETLDILRNTNPLGRGADPEEVSNLALFLASDESSYMNGAEFVIDGGAFATS